MSADAAIAEITRRLAAADERLFADIVGVDQAFDAWMRERPPVLTAPPAVRQAFDRHRRDVHGLRLAVASVRSGPTVSKAKMLTVKALELWEQGLVAWEQSVTTKNASKQQAASRDAERLLRQTEDAIAGARRALGLPA